MFKDERNVLKERAASLILKAIKRKLFQRKSIYIIYITICQ